MTKSLISIVILSAMSCASSSTETRSPARILKVCSYNLLVNWMGSGASASSVLQGDAKKVTDVLNAGKNLNSVCDENEDTIKEDF